MCHTQALSTLHRYPQSTMEAKRALCPQSKNIPPLHNPFVLTTPCTPSARAFRSIRPRPARDRREREEKKKEMKEGKGRAGSRVEGGEVE